MSHGRKPTESREKTDLRSVLINLTCPHVHNKLSQDMWLETELGDGYHDLTNKKVNSQAALTEVVPCKQV